MRGVGLREGAAPSRRPAAATPRAAGSITAVNWSAGAVAPLRVQVSCTLQQVWELDKALLRTHAQPLLKQNDEDRILETCKRVVGQAPQRLASRTMICGGVK